MKNQVITVALINQYTTPPIMKGIGRSRTAICLQKSTYEKAEREIEVAYSTLCLYQHKEYKLSDYFHLNFGIWKTSKEIISYTKENITPDRKCYKILLGDEKIIIDEEEIIDQ